MPVDEHLSEHTWSHPCTALEGIRDHAVGKFVRQVQLTLIPDEMPLKRRDPQTNPARGEAS